MLKWTNNRSCERGGEWPLAIPSASRLAVTNAIDAANCCGRSTMESLLRMAFVLASLSIASAAQAQEPQGDWQGALVLPGAQLRVVVHIQKSADGRYAGSLDSPDQAAKGIPIADVAVDGQTLTFKVPALQGRYRATWDDSQSQWKGDWTQIASVLPLNLARIEQMTGLDGDWDGTVDIGAARLRAVFHIRTSKGVTTSTSDSPDQGAFGMPVSSITRTNDTIKLEVSQAGATFEGRLSPDGRVLSGQLLQGGRSMPFSLTRRGAGAISALPRRPQSPMSPYPYREEEVTYQGGAADVRIGGTLTIPTGAGPFPAVVLIHGSGPNDRNETAFGHEIFKVLADHLTRSGIAVLRFDKRGIKASTGDYAAATTVDFAADAETGITYLKSRPEIKKNEIGLVGHSEGGLIAPMVAARNASVAFIVMMAGPALRGDHIVEAQVRFHAQEAGVSVDQIEKRLELQRKLESAAGSARDSIEAAADLREVYRTAGLSDPAAEAGARALSTNWYRFILTYDPVPALTQVKCPVLAINGSKDAQVPPVEDLATIREALANNPDAEIRELPGLNHLFQTADSGSPREYSTIEETIAPTALELISGWIKKHTTKPAP
jgi:uncharacterized protein